MKYRKLGRWGLRVSEVGLGSWLTYGGSVGDEIAADCVRRAFDLGVNFFDTANVYARGRAEEVVGKALAGLPRDQYVLGSKVFFPMGEGPNDRGLSRKHVTEQCHASLRRLGTDYVDLYQCHRFDPDTPLEETCRAMDDLVRQGKILYWGVSEWTAGQMQEAVEICEQKGLYPPASDQPRYNLLEREAEQEVLPACERMGMGIVCFSPLAQGVLTGKYASAEDAPAGSRAADPEAGQFIEQLLTAENLARAARLRAVAGELGVTAAQLAVAWTLRRSEVSSAIIGASRVEHVEENARAFEVGLDGKSIRRIEQAVG